MKGERSKGSKEMDIGVLVLSFRQEEVASLSKRKEVSSDRLLLTRRAGYVGAMTNLTIANSVRSYKSVFMSDFPALS